MLNYNILRNLVLSTLKEIPETQYKSIITGVQELAASQNAFPSQDECREKNIDYRYYKEKRLNRKDIYHIFVSKVHHKKFLTLVKPRNI